MYSQIFCEKTQSEILQELCTEETELGASAGLKSVNG